MIAQKLAAKMLLVACLGLISACGLVFLPKAKATTILGNADPMSRSCATNYTRTLPNYCGRTTAPSSSTLTSDGTCRSINLNTVHGIPTSSTAARIGYSGTIASANAVAFRQVTTNLFTNNTCVTSAGVSPLITGAREWVAVAATTIYNFSPIAIFDARLGSGALIYYNSTLSSCVNCNHGLIVYGYYD